MFLYFYVCVFIFTIGFDFSFFCFNFQGNTVTKQFIVAEYGKKSFIFQCITANYHTEHFIAYVS